MTDADTRKQYNKAAEEYHEYVSREDNVWHKYMEKPLLKKILKEKIKSKKVLDLGCGSGIFSNELLKLGAKKVVGLDLSDELIEIGKKEYPKIELVQGNAKKTNFKRSEFDVVVSSLTAHYFKNLNELFKEVSRVLKNNGSFVFSMQHPIMEVSGRLRIKGKIIPGKSELKNYFEDKEYTMRLGKELVVTSYHHTFENIFNSLNRNGFVIENLFETKPNEKVKKLNPKVYERARRRPSFLVIEARKK